MSNVVTAATAAAAAAAIDRRRAFKRTAFIAVHTTTGLNRPALADRGGVNRLPNVHPTVLYMYVL